MLPKHFSHRHTILPPNIITKVCTPTYCLTGYARVIGGIGIRSLLKDMRDQNPGIKWLNGDSVGLWNKVVEWVEC